MYLFASKAPTSVWMNRTLLPSLSALLIFIAFSLTTTFSPSVKAQYVTTHKIGMGVVDYDRVAGPRWRRVSFVPLVSGPNSINLSWDGDAEIRFSIFQAHDSQPTNDRLRIGTSRGGTNVQRWTGILNPSENYYLGVWAASGSANFTATIEAKKVTDAPIEIVRQPADQSITAGEDAVFSVNATGSDSLNYQWFADTVAINGAVSDTLTIKSPPLSVSGTAYLVVINDPNGSITSIPATLTVNAIPATLTVNAKPAALTIIEN